MFRGTTDINDESIPWVKRAIAEGTKGPIIAELKCLRCISCRMENSFLMPRAEIWLYIRKHSHGNIKYFISNMSDEAEISKLDRLATARWSIEQCFQECKSYLRITHYETRSYQAWHRHMLLVMIAQLFLTILRHRLKKDGNLTMPMVHYILAALIPIPSRFELIIKTDVERIKLLICAV